MQFLIAILIITVIIFGVSSGMQSYATARQADAAIEVAQVAQVNAWGNLITLLGVAFVILLLLMIIAGVLWLGWKRSKPFSAPERALAPGQQSQEPEQMNIGKMLELMLLAELLRNARANAPNQNLIDAPKEEPADDPLHWLR